MGILLYILATVLWVILTPLNWIIVAIKHGLSNNYFRETAVDIDRFGNRNFRTFLNTTLITKDGYKFGNEKETISSALGKNQELGTLTFFGIFVADTLDFIDKDHCKNSINNNL